MKTLERLQRQKSGELSGRKSPQKRPIWRRIGIVRFAETGWWRHSGTNWRPTTQSSNQSLRSASGTEFFDAETEGQIRLFVWQRLTQRRGRSRKSPLLALNNSLLGFAPNCHWRLLAQSKKQRQIGFCNPLETNDSPRFTGAGKVADAIPVKIVKGNRSKEAA
jgi:hypothetical protein